MDREGSANEPHTRRSRAEFAQPVDAGLYDTRFIGQAEVIVRREDEHIAPSFHLHPRGLWRVEMIEALVDLVGLQLIDGALERVRKIGVEGHVKFLALGGRKTQLRS
jgi:hypothetical protein